MSELREMPSSLNDACRKLDDAYAEIDRLRSALGQIQHICRHVDDTEPSIMARIKLIADTAAYQQQVTEK